MKLKEYLEKNNITTYEFADIVNVTPTTIYNILKGKDTYLSLALRIQEATKRKVKCHELY